VKNLIRVAVAKRKTWKLTCWKKTRQNSAFQTLTCLL